MFVCLRAFLYRGTDLANVYLNSSWGHFRFSQKSKKNFSALYKVFFGTYTL